MVARVQHAISLGLYADHWNGPARGAGPGLALSSAGLLCTIAAGFLRWMLVQTYHVGVRLTQEQERDEFAVRNVRTIHPRHGRAA